jgi:diadenylate cyclase
MRDQLLVIIRNLFEISILAALFYLLLRLLRGTRGLVMLSSIFMLFALLQTATFILDLAVLSWILQKMLYFMPFIVLIIFQNEIRRILTLISIQYLRMQHWQRRGQEMESPLVKSLCDICERLSQSSTGALIAIEQKISLNSHAETGKIIDAPLIADNSLVETIFYSGTPLHDGGIIIRKNSIYAAGCVFPLCEKDEVRADHGMRHQAAVGLSEQTDAIVIVVSEESGALSVAYNGQLRSMSSMEQCRQLLKALLPLESSLAPRIASWSPMQWLGSLAVKKNKPAKAAPKE